MDIYLIRSAMSIHEMDDFLSQYGPVGPMRIQHDKNGIETKKTLVLMPSETYARLVQEDYDKPSKSRKMSVKPYKVLPSQLPGPGMSPTIYIPFPRKMNMSFTDTKSQLVDAINAILNCLDITVFKLEAPLKSREIKDDYIKSFFLTFDKEVSTETRAKVMLMLNETRWFGPEDDSELRVAHWARNSKNFKTTSKNE